MTNAHATIAEASATSSRLPLPFAISDEDEQRLVAFLQEDLARKKSGIAIATIGGVMLATLAWIALFTELSHPLLTVRSQLLSFLGAGAIALAGFVRVGSARFEEVAHDLGFNEQQAAQARATMLDELKRGAR